MLAMGLVTYREPDLATIKILLVLAIVALLAVALYERWPKWRS